MGRKRKSGQYKHPHYVGLLGYLKNLRLDSKYKAKPCKTFTQECDTIKPCSLKEKRNHLAVVRRMDGRRTRLAMETIWSDRVVRQDRMVALTQENRRK